MIGKSLGPYRIDRELGSGGMGKVYAATVTGRCPGLTEGTAVALKVVHPHLLETAGFFRRFMREGELGAKIQDEHVVRTFLCDQIVVGGTPHAFLVMEYVEGQTLRALLEDLERVPEELCLHIGREVAKGLAAIHEAGVVHRDVKPENVLITADHAVKIMDLGVARLVDESIRLSRTGMFVGSIEYAAPEQFAKGGEATDGRADLHALGVVLYELATGRHPYRGEDVRQVLRNVLQSTPRKAGELNPQLSPFFEESVHRLLAKNKQDRFGSATELADVLEEGEESAWWKERAKALRIETKRPLRRIRIPRETALHGREQELGVLRTQYEAAKSGDGRVILIEGEAGIGKSRLVDEFVGLLQTGGEDLNFLFGSYPPGGAATAAGGFSSAFREHFGDEGSAPYLADAPLLVPAFDALLRGEPAPPDAVALNGGSIGTCFVRATQGLAAERPTVILIDDLHFAPEESRQMFSALAMSVPGHRVLLIGTTRPGTEDAWRANITRLPHATQLSLARLGPKDLAELLKDSFRSEELAARLGHQIAIKSDGNPFFVFEIIRGLREGQFIRQKPDGTWVTTRVVENIEIPSSVLDLVNGRVADLTEEERDLLDVACCWGFEFDPGLIGDVLGIGRIPLLKRFGQIERKHRLVRAAGRHMVFDHHQVQEALYGSLLEQLREEYHAALAVALETRTKAAEVEPETLDGALCVDLCEHFLMGARGESALRYLAPAQAHLQKGYLNAHMISLTERALAVPGLLTGVPRARVLLRLAMVNGPLNLLGRRARQEECAREAERLAEEADDDKLRASVATALGALFDRTARHEDGRAQFQRALDLSRALGDRQLEAAAKGHLGSVSFHRGRLEEAKELFEQGFALSREIGDRGLEATSTTNLGNVSHGEGRFADARKYYERSLALHRETGNRRGVIAATGNLGATLRAQGHLVEAQEHYGRSIALAREIGDRLGEAIGLVNLGPIHQTLGHSDRARAALESCVALCQEIGAPYPEGYGLLGLARLADEEGDTALARQLIGESLALRREIGHGDGVGESLLALGEILLEEGPAEEARAALTEALALAREQGRRPLVAQVLCLLARLPGGDADAAQAALAEAGESDDAHKLYFDLWKATGDRAHLAEARRLLDDSLAKVPAEVRESMRSSIRVHREILSACEEEGLTGGM